MEEKKVHKAGCFGLAKPHHYGEDKSNEATPSFIARVNHSSPIRWVILHLKESFILSLNFMSILDLNIYQNDKGGFQFWNWRCLGLKCCSTFSGEWEAKKDYGSREVSGIRSLVGNLFYLITRRDNMHASSLLSRFTQNQLKYILE